MDPIKINNLLHHYDKYFAELGRPRHTSIGMYQPTNLRDVRIVFDQLHAEGFLEPLDVLIDAGGGDGRVAALASLYDTIAYSMEGDRQIHALAEQRVENARTQGILSKEWDADNNLHLGYGDFLETRVYGKLFGCDFDDFLIFFNAGDNELPLAQLLNKNKKKEKFLIAMQSSGAGINQWMQHIDTCYDGTRALARVYRSK